MDYIEQALEEIEEKIGKELDLKMKHIYFKHRRLIYTLD